MGVGESHFGGRVGSGMLDIANVDSRVHGDGVVVHEVLRLGGRERGEGVGPLILG